MKSPCDASETAVIVPIRSFQGALSRLAGILGPSGCRELMRRMAGRVVAAADGLPVHVATDDTEVAAWAAELGAAVVRAGRPGLSHAVTVAVDLLAAAGIERAVVAHADLALARSLRPAVGPGLTIVPDLHRDGSNVVCVPAAAGFRFSYGPGSFGRHVAEARRLGLDVTAVEDDTLAVDIDRPEDLLALPEKDRLALGLNPPDCHNHQQEPREPLRRATHGQRDTREPRGCEPDAASARLPHSDSSNPTTRQDRPVTTRDLPVPSRALAIGAHPDDIEFGCGATLAKWAEAGCAASLLVCTDGSKGTWDADADTAALAARRRSEQTEAARRLGATGEVRFLGEVDGELEVRMALRGEIARTIRELRPEVVLGHDPWQRWRLHPDHRAAGFLCLDAVVAARDPHFFKEHGMAHHRPSELLLFECEAPNHIEQVSEAHIEAKVSALLAHESQFESTHGISAAQDAADVAAFRAEIVKECRNAARPAGLHHCEAFRRIERV